jgi:hypothetical protein
MWICQFLCLKHCHEGDVMWVEGEMPGGITGANEPSERRRDGVYVALSSLLKYRLTDNCSCLRLPFIMKLGLQQKEREEPLIDALLSRDPRLVIAGRTYGYDVLRLP